MEIVAAAADPPSWQFRAARRHPVVEIGASLHQAPSWKLAPLSWKFRGRSPVPHRGNWRPGRGNCRGSWVTPIVAIPSARHPHRGNPDRRKSYIVTRFTIAV